MNAKLITLLAASLVTGCNYADASGPIAVEQQEQISIVSPAYVVDDIDLGPYRDCKTDCTAVLLTQDKQFQIEVNFDYRGFRDGNGYQSWSDVEIERLDIEGVFKYDDETEVNAYVDRYEIEQINRALEKKIEEEVE